jgi:hypothetical protein
VKLPDVAPLGTATDAGTVNAALLLERPTVVAPEGADKDNATVQFDAPPDCNAEGWHCTDVTDGSTPILPPLPVISASLPSVSPPTTLLIANTSVVALLEGESVAVITAATPVAIGVAFVPDARHVNDPTPETQFKLFADAVSAGPAVAATDAISVAEYDSVH